MTSSKSRRSWGFSRRKIAEGIGEKWSMFVERVQASNFFARVFPR
jgi:ubiquinone biosynthesis protein UbiJ